MPTRACRPYARCKSELVIVCGAPASGKTTYVREHMRAGDLAWDYDAVMHAITGLPVHSEPPDGAVEFVLGMRERFCAIAARSETGIRRVWVIVSERCAFTTSLHLLGATFIDLDTPVEVCRERLRARGAGAERALDEYLGRHQGAT